MKVGKKNSSKKNKKGQMIELSSDDDVQKDNWVLAKFQAKKTLRYYVGNVLEQTPSDFELSFSRR